jgi:hypothetical protein
MELSLDASIRNLWGAHGSESRGRNGAAEARKCSPRTPLVQATRGLFLAE